MRLRSIVIIDGGEDHLAAALASSADAIALMFADAGAAGDQRAGAPAALARIRESGKSAIAIVNHPRTQILRADLEAVVTPDLAAVIFPHAVEPQDVRDLAVLLREFEYTRAIEPGTVRICPSIDSARGLVRALEIAAATPRAGGLVFESAGYARDTGARDEASGPRLAYARGAVVAAARATDGLPVIQANSFELTQLAHYGFAGAAFSDVMAVGAANAAFLPTSTELAHARAQLEAYAAAKAEGAWVARLGTEVVDSDSVRKARLILAQAGEG